MGPRKLQPPSDPFPGEGSISTVRTCGRGGERGTEVQRRKATAGPVLLLRIQVLDWISQDAGCFPPRSPDPSPSRLYTSYRVLLGGRQGPPFSMPPLPAVPIGMPTYLGLSGHQAGGR